MNWQSVSFDWNQVRAFLVTAEEGSFSGAARTLNTTQPTIGRQITALEEALGVTLFERSVRGLTLTEAGRELMAHVETMAEAASNISLVADGQSQNISGEVAITATDLFSAIKLPELLFGLRDRAPGLRIRIIASSDIQNLMRREADIAIRHVRPDQPELIARHIGSFGANLYAARSYLEREGRPRTPREVADHPFVGNADPKLLVGPLNAKGIPVRPENFVMSTENGIVAWELMKAGYGFAMQPDALAHADPGVEQVLPELPSDHFPVWLVTHRELRNSRKIRLVYDVLAEGLTRLTS